VPIVPSQHYTMGGIDTDMDGVTRMPGLYAAGECACVSVHGAHRLGGNSLLETIVFGRRAGKAVAEFLAGGGDGRGAADAAARETLAAVEGRVDRLSRAPASEDAYDIRAEMIDTMKTHFGIFREARQMQEGVDKLLSLRERLARIGLRHAGGPFNLDMIRTIELEGMLDVAIATAVGAFRRTESRGSHARTDYPNRDDEHWLAHTLAHYRLDGPPELTATTVALGMFEPQERKY